MTRFSFFFLVFGFFLFLCGGEGEGCGNIKVQ